MTKSKGTGKKMAEIDKCRGVSVVNNLKTRQHIVDRYELHCYYVKVSTILVLLLIISICYQRP